MNARKIRAIAALLTMIGIAVGVPLLLVTLVGNPWPGSARIEMRDELATVIGVLTVLAWIVWARFVIAVAIELRGQLAELRTLRDRPISARVVMAAPPARSGIGLIAQRLVAAALVLLPVAVQSSPAMAADAGGSSAARPVAAVVATTGAAAFVAATDVSGVPGPSTAAFASVSTSSAPVTVATGDTLIAIARAHLGDAGRWREIFELNRDRPQPDGAKLTSPSLIRAGWLLELPAGAVAAVADVAASPVAAAPALVALATAPDAAAATVVQDVPTQPPHEAPVPYLAAADVVVERGDNLWDLARERLAGAGLAHDDVAVADYVHAVIEGNPDVVENPNLIFVGEQFAFPSVGTPPPPPAAPLPAPSVEVAAPVAAAPATPPPPVTPAPVVEAPTALPEAAVTSTPTPETTVAPETTVMPETTVAPETTVMPGTTVTSTTSTTVPAELPPPGNVTPLGVEASVPGSPAPIGLGEATLLSAGVVALLASRRRMRLRASPPRARVPEPSPDSVAAERRLRAVDAGERILRVDIAVRAAAATLVEGPAQIAIVLAASDGGVELRLTAPAALPAPWTGDGDTWVLPGQTPVELLAEAARSVGAPCAALAQLGVTVDGREVLVDLEALGVLAIDAPPELGDAVVRGVTATLASSIFAEVANLVGVDVDEAAFLEHRHAHIVESVDSGLELAATLVGTTGSAKQSTFVLRARHTSGEAWEPAVLLVGAAASADLSADLLRPAVRRRGGLAIVAGGPVADSPWVLRADSDGWVLDPLGLVLVPVGLTSLELAELHEVLAAADAPLIDDESTLDGETLAALVARSVAVGDDAPTANEPDGADGADISDDHVRPDDVEVVVPAVREWSLMVRLLGQVEVVDTAGTSAVFERSKALELIAWLALHRERATRAGARTALWDLDVRDATFANVVSEARRAMARLVDPPTGEEWLGRTLTEVLPLHADVVSDADIVRERLDIARLQPPELAIETLHPAVEMIRDMPFAGTGYLWPDAEGITSNLVLLATSAATELAGHHLSMGDVEGVFWATGQGLRVLPGHEELIALRMRAHARAGDLSGVRLEWESYERVLNADPWSDGEPAPKLVLLRRQLLTP